MPKSFSETLKSGFSNMLLLLTCFYIFISASFAAPLARNMVDLTHVFDETTLKYPLFKKYEMNIIMNGSTDEWDWLQYEEFATGTHSGTHMDAPSHFIKGGIGIDQIPLDQLTGPAAVINIREKGRLDPDAEADIQDLLQWESQTGQSLDGTIILLQTGWAHFWSNQTAYFGNPDNDNHNLHFPGLAPEAAEWLVEHRHIKGIGTDTLSLDHGKSTRFGSHLALLGAGVFIMENLGCMDEIPIYGAKLYALPLKLGKASGAPTRVIATYPKVMFGYTAATTVTTSTETTETTITPSE